MAGLTIQPALLSNLARADDAAAASVNKNSPERESPELEARLALLAKVEAGKGAFPEGMPAAARIDYFLPLVRDYCAALKRGPAPAIDELERAVKVSLADLDSVEFTSGLTELESRGFIKDQVYVLFDTLLEAITKIRKSNPALGARTEALARGIALDLFNSEYHRCADEEQIWNKAIEVFTKHFGFEPDKSDYPEVSNFPFTHYRVGIVSISVAHQMTGGYSDYLDRTLKSFHEAHPEKRLGLMTDFFDDQVQLGRTLVIQSGLYFLNREGLSAGKHGEMIRKVSEIRQWYETEYKPKLFAELPFLVAYIYEKDETDELRKADKNATYVPHMGQQALKEKMERLIGAEDSKLEAYFEGCRTLLAGNEVGDAQKASLYLALELLPPSERVKKMVLAFLKEQIPREQAHFILTDGIAPTLRKLLFPRSEYARPDPEIVSFIGELYREAVSERTSSGQNRKSSFLIIVGMLQFVPLAEQSIGTSNQICNICLGEDLYSPLGLFEGNRQVVIQRLGQFHGASYSNDELASMIVGLIQLYETTHDEDGAVNSAYLKAHLLELRERFGSFPEAGPRNVFRNLRENTRLALYSNRYHRLPEDCPRNDDFERLARERAFSAQFILACTVSQIMLGENPGTRPGERLQGARIQDAASELRGYLRLLSLDSAVELRNCLMNDQGGEIMPALRALRASQEDNQRNLYLEIANELGR